MPLHHFFLAVEGEDLFVVWKQFLDAKESIGNLISELSRRRGQPFGVRVSNEVQGSFLWSLTASFCTESTFGSDRAHGSYRHNNRGVVCDIIGCGPLSERNLGSVLADFD